MASIRQPRIVIEDLSVLEHLTEEEMARILGAGTWSRARLEVEALERRELMASHFSASLNSGLLRIDGTDQADRIDIHQTGNAVKVTAKNPLESLSRTYDASKVLEIRVVGAGGNDVIDLHGSESSGTRIRSELFGGAGADLLYGGLADDILYGQGGNDTLQGWAGTDAYNGGGGSDRVTLLEAREQLTVNGFMLSRRTANKWLELGGESSFLGAPTCNETVTGDSVGRVTNFQGGSIYWSAASGGCVIAGNNGAWMQTSLSRSVLAGPNLYLRRQDGAWFQLQSTHLVSIARTAVDVSLNTGGPSTGDTLIATALPSGGSGPAQLTYSWTVNGNVVQTRTTTEATDRLDLGLLGAHKGDVIQVTVTADDGITDRAVASASAVVANTPPVATYKRYTLNASQIIRGNLIHDDTGADADPDVADLLTVTAIAGQPFVPGQPISVGGGGGLLTIEADGSFTYDPTRSGFYIGLPAGIQSGDLFSYSIGDGKGATATAHVFMVVYGVNEAPSFTGDATLAGVDQNAANPAGDSVAHLFSSLFTDADFHFANPAADAHFAGIAVVGDHSTLAQGVWQYSSDGATWLPIRSVSDNGWGLALSVETRLRFLPAANYSGTPGALVVRAIDDSYGGGFSSGANRIAIDTTTSGGATAIAATTSTLATRVNYVNSAPVVAVRLSSAAPRASDILTATSAPSDADGNPVTLTYVWKVNGTVVQTHTTSAFIDTLDLRQPGHGVEGDVVTVTVTASDALAAGAPASTSAIITGPAQAAAVMRSQGLSSTAIATSLHSTFSIAAADAARILHDVGADASEIAVALQAVYGYPGVLTAGVLQGLNFDAGPIAAAMLNAYHCTARDTAGILAYVNFTPGAIARALQAAYVSVTQGNGQVVFDGRGLVYRLQDGVLSCGINSLSEAQQFLTGVTQMAVDSAGEVVVLQGPHRYLYYLGAYGPTGYSADAQFVLDSQGCLYTLKSGALTVAADSQSIPKQIVAGVSQMALDRSGALYAVNNHGVSACINSQWQYLAVGDAALALKNVFGAGDQAAAGTLKSFGLPASDIVRVLSNLYGDSTQSAATILKNLGETASDIAAALATVFGSNDRATAQILSNVGMSWNDVAMALKNAFGDSGRATAGLFKDLGATTSDIARALATAFAENAQDIASTLNFLHVPLSDIVQALCNLGTNATGITTALRGFLGDVQAVAQFGDQTILYLLENRTLYLARTGALPTIIATQINSLAQFGDNQVLIMDHDGTVYRATPQRPDDHAGTGLVDTLLPFGDNQVVYLKRGTGLLYTLAVGGQPVYQASGVQAVVQFGGNQVLYLLQNGVMYSWSAGNAPAYQAGGVKSLTQFGFNQALYTLQDGSIYSWAVGGRPTSQLAGATSVVQLGNNAVLFLLPNGLLYSWTAGGSPVLQLAGVKQLGALGTTDNYYLMPDGNLYSWRIGSTPYHFGQNASVVPDGSIWYLSPYDSDGLGDHAIIHIHDRQYDFSNRQTTTAIFATWIATGGPSSAVGIPTSDAVHTTGCVFQQFANGYLYTLPADRQARVFVGSSSPGVGALGQKWFALGGPAGSLGAPTGSSGLHNQWSWQEFEHGAVYSDGSTALAISGDIWTEYATLNQSAGFLGLPTSDVNSGNGFRWQNFQRGVIYWSPATGAHALLGNPGDQNTIWGRWAQQGFEHGPLGLPTSDRIDFGSGWWGNRFEHGAIVTNGATTQVLIGASLATQQMTAIQAGQVAILTSTDGVQIDGLRVLPSAIDPSNLPPTPVAQAGTILLDVESGPRTEVVNGWTRAYGETIDEEEYFEATAATVASVVTANPAPLIAFLQDFIDEQVTALAQNVGMSITEQFLKSVIDANGAAMPLNGFQFRFGILTQQRDVQVGDFMGHTCTLFSYNVHTPYIEWRAL